MQTSHTSPDGRTVVHLSPNFRNEIYTHYEYWSYRHHKRFWTRWPQKIAMVILKKWGQPYQQKITVKSYEPISSDSDIAKSIMRQMDTLIRYYGIYPEGMCFFVGEEGYQDLMQHTIIGMPDFAYADSDGRRTWKGMRAIIIPDMKGAIVVNRKMLLDALDQDRDITTLRHTSRNIIKS